MAKTAVACFSLAAPLLVVLAIAGCGGSSSSGSRGDGSLAVRGGPPAPGIDAALVDAAAPDAPAAAVDRSSSLDAAPDVAPYACRQDPPGQGCCRCKDPGGRGDVCCLQLDCGGTLCQGECYGVTCAGMCVPQGNLGCTPSGAICGTFLNSGSNGSLPYCSTCPYGDTAAARAAGVSCPAGTRLCALDMGKVCTCGSIGAGTQLARALLCCDQGCQS